VAVHPDAEVDPSAVVAASATVWAQTSIREGAQIGERTSIGRQAYVGPGVRIGEDCKIQNHALLYEPAVLENGVFVGPAVVFTNDRLPRAITPDGRQKTAADWQPVGVTVRRGASIGARVVCVAPVEIGEWASVAAGAVVVNDVPAHALVAGVPARQLGWVGRSGRRLVEEGEHLVDPDTGDRYSSTAEGVTHLDREWSE
jgi:UDP-2-acetamido-3-amino-2,3-dideoxy-glucuronate N-acetyltransferase